MSLQELFPVEELSHVELYARLRGYQGDFMALTQYATEGIAKYPLPMCQILTVCYQRDSTSATFIRSLINSFQLPTDCSLRLLATAVVPHTLDDNELFTYIDTNPSPFFRERMIRLLKRSKRHAVIDRLLQTTKNPTNNLAELIHLASSTALGQFYWEYESKKGINFNAIFRFHAKTFLELCRKALLALPWQQRETFWENNIFKRTNLIIASKNTELFEGLLELFYDLPSTRLAAAADSKVNITATETLSDKYKVLSGGYKAALSQFAAHCKFSFVFNKLLTDPAKVNCYGPSQLFLPLVTDLWNNLLQRTTLKASEAKAACHFIVHKIETIANSSEPGAVAALLARFSINSGSSTSVTVEAMQREFWSTLFSFLTGRLSALNILVGDGLNAIVLEKILLTWRGHFESINFLTGSSHAVVIEQELFTAIRDRMLNGIFQSMTAYDSALRTRFLIILKSYAKDHSKSKHFHPLLKAFEDMYSVYNTMLSDILTLASTFTSDGNFYVSFQNLIAHMIEKIVGAMKIDKYLRKVFKRDINYGLQGMIIDDEMPPSNPDIAAFLEKAQSMRNLPALTAWMTSWKNDVAQYFIHCADPALVATQRQITVFSAVTGTARTAFLQILRENISTGDLVKFADYLLDDIIRPCQAFPPTKESTASYRNGLEINGRIIFDFLMVILARFVAEKQNCVRIMTGLYEVYQWKELLRSNLDTGNYTYVFPFLTKVVRDINNSYCNESPLILTLNDFIGKVNGEAIAANAHPIFDVRKENQCVFDFIEACKSKRIFYPMMQELIVLLVDNASTKEEYKMYFDMYRLENWKKEEAQSTRVRALFEENIFKVLPVTHSLTIRYLKRRLTTCCSTLEEKVKCYTEFMDSSAIQASAFAYDNNQKEIFCQSYGLIQPMMKNVQWNAKGLRYPVNFSKLFGLYIPTMKDFCDASLVQQLKIAHTLEAAQEMISLLQTVCNDKLQVESEYFKQEVQTMFASAAETAFTSYATALVLQASIDQGNCQILCTSQQIQHFVILLNKWLDFFLQMKYLSESKISGKETAESLTDIGFDTAPGYRFIRNMDEWVRDGDKNYWGLHKNGWKLLEKSVTMKYLTYLRSFYSQYVTKMPLTPAGYESCNHQFTNEAFEVLKNFLTKYLSIGAYHQDCQQMLQVIFQVIQNTEEYSNRHSNSYYDEMLSFVRDVSFPYIVFNAAKLTPKNVHFTRPKEHELVSLHKEDALVYNEEEIAFLEVYRNGIIAIAEKLPVFPTAKVMAINHRIAMFRTPKKSDLDIMLDSFEMIATKVCPSIIRYKFIAHFLLEHRPQFFVQLLTEEQSKGESSKLRKNALIIKRTTTRYSVPFYTRVSMCLNESQKMFFQQMFIKILLNTSSESLKDRKNASQWITHLNTLSMEQLLSLYENHLLLGREEFDEDVTSMEVEEEQEPGATGDEVEELNPALKRAILLHTLTSSHANFKKALHTIFEAKYLNDTNVNLHLLNGLSKFAQYYGSTFSDEVVKCLNPNNPAFIKMGVSGFKAIIRLCERLHGSSALLVGFWNNRAKFHRDVVVCILKSLLTLYSTQGESNQDVSQALYAYAASSLTNIQTVNEIDLLQVIMNVIPGEEFINKEWLQKYQAYRAPSSNEQTMIILATQETTRAFFENVLSIIMTNIHQYHENTLQVVIDALRLWFGFSDEHNKKLRDFYLSYVDVMAIPFVDGDVKRDAGKAAFQVLSDIAKLCRESFINKSLNPTKEVCAMFLKFMNAINEEGSNAKMSFDDKFSLIQKIQMIQDYDVFRVQEVYDKFDKKVVTQMEELYAALSGVYKKMSKKRRFDR